MNQIAAAPHDSSPRRNTLRHLGGSLALPLLPSVALGGPRPRALVVLAHRNPPAQSAGHSAKAQQEAPGF